MLGLILAITLEILPRNCYGCIRYLCFYYFYSYRSILQQFRLLTDQGDKLELTSLHFLLHSLLRYIWPIFRISYHFYLLRKSMFYWWGLSQDIFCNPQLITLFGSIHIKIGVSNLFCNWSVFSGFHNNIHVKSLTIRELNR